MDVIDDRDHAFILYAASLRWKAIHLGYTGSIEYNPDFGSKTSGEFAKSSSLPVIDNGQLSWLSNGHSFKWTSVDPPLRELLLDRDNGTVLWDCLQPKALCEITEGNKHVSSGYGYTEKLELKIAPWNLPIRELLWGRYLSRDHTITWICWRGPEPRSIVFHNGNRVPLSRISEKHVSWGEYTILLPRQVMRNDTIGQSVFGKFKDIMKLFPQKIMGLEEIKLCGTSELRDSNSVIDTGSVIHEIVNWQ